MRITGFLANKDNAENGFLRNCLTSMSIMSDYICVYDDCSYENTKAVYDEFECIVVYGEKPAFKRELYSKQMLLDVALRTNPEWLTWFDGDAILGSAWETRSGGEEILAQAEEQEIVLLHLHNLNLYRSYGWYRVDHNYNDLNHGVFWRNTGQLHYNPSVGLHQAQYPQFWHDGRPIVSSVFMNPRAQLLHFGFATSNETIRKYLMYKDQGQTGYRLDRLASEEGLRLDPVNKEWFPDWFEMRDMSYPGPLDWDEIRKIPNLENWENG